MDAAEPLVSLSDYSYSALFFSEFVGTAVLILIGVGVSANVSLSKSLGYRGGWLLACFGWAFGVFTGASIAWRSGGQLNPAVSIAQSLTDPEAQGWDLTGLFIVAQVLGALTGALLAYLAYKKQFDTHDEPENTGGAFFTAPTVRAPAWNVVSEAIATFVLVFFVIESSPLEVGVGDGLFDDSKSALGYAATAFVILAIATGLGGPTGYAINPARDLGPRIFYAIAPIKGKGSADWSYAWVPIVGPVLGAFAAFGLFTLGQSFGVTT